MAQIRFKFNISILAILYSSDVNDLCHEENDIEVIEEISINKDVLKNSLTMICVIGIIALAPSQISASYLLMDKKRFRDETEEYPSFTKYLNSYVDRSEWGRSIRFRKFSKYTGHLIDMAVGTGIGLGVSYGITRLTLGLQECKSEVIAKNLKILSQSGLVKRYREENFFLKTKECLTVVSCDVVHDTLIPKIIESVIINMD